MYINPYTAKDLTIMNLQKLPARTAGALLAASLMLFFLGGNGGTVAARAEPQPSSAPDALIGKPAPDFSLPDQNDVSRTLSSLRGRWVVLAFYPMDKTKG